MMIPGTQGVLLQQLEDAGEAMHLAAREGDWEAVESCRRRLQSAAEAVFSCQPDAGMIADITRVTQEVLEKSVAATRLCAQARDRKMQDMRHASHSRTAMRQYSDNSVLK